MFSLQKTHFSFRSLIIVILIIIALCTIVTYVMFQARFLIQGPSLVLTNEPKSVQNEKIIHLAGTARNTHFYQ